VRARPGTYDHLPMAPAPTISLGPFDLDRPIGKGGMGEVWRAVHRGMGMPVAVKVLTAHRARDPDFVAAFRGEVRAVAALDHPRIIHVHDHGSVDRAAQRASEGALIAGSPWLAMDLVEGGALDARLVAGQLSWGHQRRILLRLLGALAYAHARGLVHRDLKPANVLLRDPDDPGGGLVLTDFGLAQAGEEREVAGLTEAPSGTPHYMAPEQFEGHWRDYGPWTDLYALGCLAFRMATGRHPYAGSSMFALAFSHLQGKREAFTPRVCVPSDLEVWIGRLLRIAPGARFQRAADAAFALRQLVEPEEGTLDDTVDEPIDWDAPTVQLVKAITETRLLSARTEVQQHLAPTSAPAVPPPVVRPEDRVRSVAPLPLDWRTLEARHDRAAIQLPGAGLGLFGLRTIPLVGREPERDLLWAALAEARRTGAFRMAVLRGPAGTGKSRLADWIALRADEAGSATVLRVRHAPEGGAGSGLGPMLGRFLRCQGLDKPAIRDRVETILQAEGAASDYEVLGLSEVMVPGDDASAAQAPFVFSGPSERHGLLRRFLTRIGDGRPLVLLFDDVQWGADALSFIRALRSAGELAPIPVLVVATVREEPATPGSEVERLLTELLAQPEVRALDVLPLEPDDHRRLVERLLGLRGDLARAVARRTGGNPLFAVQLVGDWVDRGVLEPTLEGFRLCAGEEAVLPDGIHAVWHQRVRTALAGLPAHATSTLWVAASLGGEVDPIEWALACGQLGLSVPQPLVDRLVASGLARWSATGDQAWQFEHGLLIESLLRGAAEAHRLVDCHRACITMLQGRYLDGSRGLAARLAAHLEDGGEQVLAARRWLEATKEDLILAEYAGSEAAVVRGEAALRAAGVPQDDPRWGEFILARLTIRRHTVRLAEALELARSGVELARRHGWTRHEASFLGDAGDVLHRIGRLAEAEELIVQGRRMHEELGDTSEAMGNLRMLASIARIRNELTEARRLLEEIRAYYRGQGDVIQEASTLRDLAMVLIAQGETGAGIDAVAGARRLYDRVGFRMGVVRCLNTLGTALYTEGRYDEAAGVLEEGLELDRQVGSGLGSMIAINLAMTEVGRGRFEVAERRITPFLTEVRTSPEPMFCLFFEAMVLTVHLGQGRFDTWERNLERVIDLMGETALSDRDMGRILAVAGEQAARRGRPDVARPVLDLALAQWSVLGEADEAAATRALLGSLPA
jgi:eukaryotic-like serine/threonine-protein kinase